MYYVKSKLFAFQLILNYCYCIKYFAYSGMLLNMQKFGENGKIGGLLFWQNLCIGVVVFNIFEIKFKQVTRKTYTVLIQLLESIIR